MRGEALRAFALAILVSSSAASSQESAFKPAEISVGRSGSGWRFLAEGGQAFRSPTQHFTEFAGAALVRDVRLGQRTRLAIELFPFLVFNETEKDGHTRERVGASAVGTLLSYDIESSRVPWGLRFDAGPGLFYGYQRIPAGGSRFNFFDQFGAFLVHRVAGHRIAAGYRYVHISNLGIVASAENPGLDFHTFVVAVD